MSYTLQPWRYLPSIQSYLGRKPPATHSDTKGFTCQIIITSYMSLCSIRLTVEGMVYGVAGWTTDNLTEPPRQKAMLYLRSYLIKNNPYIG
jgi:hypothetical protein